jgi:hypothetical protein
VLSHPCIDVFVLFFCAAHGKIAPAPSTPGPKAHPTSWFCFLTCVRACPHALSPCRVVTSAEADDCDKDLVQNNKLRTKGKIAAIPALLKLPKHILAAEAQVCPWGVEGGWVGGGVSAVHTQQYLSSMSPPSFLLVYIHASICNERSWVYSADSKYICTAEASCRAIRRCSQHTFKWGRECHCLSPLACM